MHQPKKQSGKFLKILNEVLLYKQRIWRILESWNYWLCQTTVGVPRATGQIEGLNGAIIPIFAKFSLEEPIKWFKYVDKSRRFINCTFQEAIIKNFESGPELDNIRNSKTNSTNAILFLGVPWPKFGLLSKIWENAQTDEKLTGKTFPICIPGELSVF